MDYFDIFISILGSAIRLSIPLLFGILYQGGAELSFDMPSITRDMIVVIQGLVILFMGALEYAFRPALSALFFPLGGEGNQ